MQAADDDVTKVPVVYNDKVVRQFAVMTVVWGIVGMLVGMLAAVELFYPGANLNLQFITFNIQHSQFSTQHYLLGS